MPKVNARTALLVAIGIVLALLAYSFYATRRRVLDASNDAYANGVFDALNPSLAGVKAVPTGAATV